MQYLMNIKHSIENAIAIKRLRVMQYLMNIKQLKMKHILMMSLRVMQYLMNIKRYDVIVKPRILEYNENEILPRKPSLVWEKPQIIQVKQK